MSLDALIAAAWGEHPTDPEGVLARLEGAVSLCGSAADVAAFARLGTHVAGEHLGDFARGLAFLSGLSDLRFALPGTAEAHGLARQVATLSHCAEDADARDAALLQASSPGEHPETTRARVLLAAAAMQVGRGATTRGAADLEGALELLSGPTGGFDSVAREVAATTNNLACALEDRPALTVDETALMLRAAGLSRRAWAVAGTWRHVERAEYRLCMSHLKAAQPERARLHALECLRLVRENGDEPGESFFAHEACARAAVELGDLPGACAHFDAAADALPAIEDANFRALCERELPKLGQVVGRG